MVQMAWRRHVVKERVAHRLAERRRSEREQAAHAAARAERQQQQEDTLEVGAASPWAGRRAAQEACYWRV